MSLCSNINTAVKITAKSGAYGVTKLIFLVVCFSPQVKQEELEIKI